VKLRTEPYSDRVVLAVAAAVYLPLVFMGFGADGDSYSVVNTARRLLHGGGYVMSRAPGFPTHELATAALLPFGGSIATNLGSMALSLVGLWCLLRICATLDVPHRDLVTWMVALNPLYWINSASSMDYVWALGLSLAGVYAWLTDRPRTAGVLFGLAVGARVTAVIVPAAVAMVSLLPVFLSSVLPSVLPGSTPVFKPRHILPVLVIGTAVSCALYALPFTAAGYSLAFFRPPTGRMLSYYLPEWSWAAHAARWVYKNLYLCGPPASLAILITACVYAVRRPSVKGAGLTLLVLALLVAAGYEAAFWIAPLEPAYLLPILPFLAIALAVATRSRPVLLLIIALELSGAFVTFRFLTPDIPGAATSARLTAAVEEGVLLSDVRERGRLRRAGTRR
jgi:hypothetical protein